METSSRRTATTINQNLSDYPSSLPTLSDAKVVTIPATRPSFG